MAAVTKQVATPSKTNRLLSGYGREVKHILDRTIKQNNVEVYLYGSRARGADHYASDIDLMVKFPESGSADLSSLREQFHESHIPYKVDVVDWDSADDELKKNIHQEGILIWKS